MASPRRVEVPDRFKAAFEALAGIPEPDFATLSESVQQLPPAVARSELVRIVRDVLSDGQGGLAEPIVAAIISLVPVLRSFDTTEGELAPAISRSTNLDLTEEGRSKLASRVETLLVSPPFATVGSAEDLLSELQTTFLEARILTDIRPIFSKDPHEPPSSAIVTQILKINYFDESIHSLHLAVDADDLRKLRGVIDRAEHKMATLRALLESARLPMVELDIVDEP